MIVAKPGLDRRIRKTKQALKKALIDLMKQKNIDSITITDIVNKADCNRGTFYFHYKNKGNLVTEIINEMISGLKKAFRSPYKNLNSVDLTILSPSTIVLFDYILENANFYKLVLNSNVLPGFQDKMIKTIINLMKKDLIFVTANSQLNINCDLFITYRAYGIYGLILEWVNSNFIETTTFMSQQLIGILDFYTPIVLISKDS